MRRLLKLPAFERYLLSSNRETLSNHGVFTPAGSSDVQLW